MLNMYLVDLCDFDRMKPFQSPESQSKPLKEKPTCIGFMSNNIEIRQFSDDNKAEHILRTAKHKHRKEKKKQMINLT